ncbi:related to KRI1 - KRRI-Interacting protein 1 [Melanopsichium pennsylvanicum]|uniref:Related to KRI1 - KRRI-Interacting protein 1 n=2 Tax=Melanopsichium pennsylvanicum TaxID=63383 RepID=A0AAJ4XKS3_9BASI|nr:related to KRI1-KRRI-Interacting protein 1 [Melanopsichium pennsylvanicum 4]SNX83950.1 related to KRI1 - KRRI-Interacting protein 1 [Melanopsichium pennsylvanicum]
MDLFNDAPSPSSAKLDIRTRPEESLNHFTINKDFAERYLHNKQRAEIHALEAKYGKDALNSDSGSETDSESDVTEDEDGNQINANVDAAIFRTLQRISNKDVALYDSNTDIFEQEAQAAERAAKLSGAFSTGPKKSGTTKKEKKVTLQDYQRQRVQELIQTSENPAEALADATISDRVKGIFHHDQEETMPFAQEQEELRKKVSQAFHSTVDDADDLFVKRSEAINGESSSYRDAVIASLGPDADEEVIRAAIRRNAASISTVSVLKTSKEEEAKNEDFLMNYILNRGWIDKSAEESRPMKPKLTKAVLKAKDAAEAGQDAGNEGEEKQEGQAYGRNWEAEAAELESEASFDSMADAFETAYNFRFEQGAEAFAIPTYSRTPKDSARREDNTRKRKREERATRKEEEKRLKMQELSRLKNLKRQEIVDKLKKLKEVTGSSTVDLDGLDLEGEFDPDAHDKAMQKAFGDNYYGEEDDGMEKPSWDDDIDIDDIIAEHEASTAGPSKKAKKAKQNHDDDEDRIEMDADFIDDNSAPTDDIAGGSKEAALRARLADKKLSKKDRKKLKKKLKAALSKSNPNGNADDDSDFDAEGADGVDESAMDADAAPSAPVTAEDKKAAAKSMIDDYYNLDYEDTIGDLPTRFKYTQVAPADYGMSAVDILLADDEQLNNVVGLKNLQPYRRGKNRPMDLGKKLGQFRKEVYGNTSKDKDGNDKTQKKRLGKKERMRLKAAEEGGSGENKGE